MNRLRQEINKPDQLQTKPALLRAFLFFADGGCRAVETRLIRKADWLNKLQAFEI
jgi:hypothetical protein